MARAYLATTRAGQSAPRRALASLFGWPRRTAHLWVRNRLWECGLSALPHSSCYLPSARPDKTIQNVAVMASSNPPKASSAASKATSCLHTGFHSPRCQYAGAACHSVLEMIIAAAEAPRTTGTSPVAPSRISPVVETGVPVRSDAGTGFSALSLLLSVSHSSSGTSRPAHLARSTHVRPPRCLSATSTLRFAVHARCDAGRAALPALPNERTPAGLRKKGRRWRLGDTSMLLEWSSPPSPTCNKYV